MISSSPTANGILSYKDHGLLICEAELLLQKAKVNLKGTQYREFRADVGDLMNVRHGLDTKLKIVERIVWVYSRSFR